MNTTAEVVTVNGAFAWVNGKDSILLKAVSPKGEAIALSAAQTRRLAERLLKLAATLESLSAEES